MVGLIPLFAVETIEDKWLDKFPEFKKRTEWFMKNRPDLTGRYFLSAVEGQGKPPHSLDRYEGKIEKHSQIYAR